uniref:Testis-expressed sequence 2 protein-like n=1 Tax=Sinocyclocheilus grahami TaxID=75366 RepID=A0A672PW07_SINGR
MSEGQGEAQKVEKSPGSKTNVSHPVTLYLFGRTGREKEEWFHRLFSITKAGNHIGAGILSNNTGGTENPLSNSGKTENKSRESLVPASTAATGQADCSTTVPVSSRTGVTSLKSTESSRTGAGSEVDSDETKPDWLNALIGRIFWDFLHEKYWANKVQQKIQRKLSKIRLPYFMDELSLTELAMGSSMPQITGLWLHLEVEYTGALQMTLETKINFSKLGKEGVPESETELETIHFSRSRLSVLADSDEESSSAGSSDEEEVSSADTQGTLTEKALPGVEGAAAGGSTSRRILRFVDKIAKSKYFQKATENEYIKKKIEEMSNTPLLLAVEVQELSGTLHVNIPPPPTDRIWYSFCGPPKLDLRVRPKLGEREVTFCHVTEWIEKKLQDEFQVCFDDFVMTGASL